MSASKLTSLNSPTGVYPPNTNYAAVSNDQSVVVFSSTTSPYLHPFLVNPDSGQMTPISVDTAANAASPFVALSSDGTWLIVASNTAPKLSVYKLNNDKTQYQLQSGVVTATQPTSTITAIDYCAAIDRFAISYSNSAALNEYILNTSTGGVTAGATVTTLSSNNVDVTYAPNGLAIFVTGSSTTHTYVTRSSASGTATANSLTTSLSGKAASFHPSGSYFALGFTTGNTLAVYNAPSSGSPTLLTSLTPSGAAANDLTNCYPSYSKDGSYLVAFAIADTSGINMAGWTVTTGGATYAQYYWAVNYDSASVNWSGALVSKPIWATSTIFFMSSPVNQRYTGSSPLQFELAESSIFNITNFFSNIGSTTSTFTTYNGKISADGNWAITGRNYASQAGSIYKRMPSGVFGKVQDVSTTSGDTSRAVAISSDGTYVFVGSSAGHILLKRDTGANTYSVISGAISSGISSFLRDAKFSADDQYLILAGDTTPFFEVWKRTGDTFTKLTNPSTLPTNAVYAVDITSDNKYIACAEVLSTGTGSEGVVVYKLDSDTLTKLTVPSVPAQNCYGVAWNHDGSRLALGANSSPMLYLWSRVDDTLASISPTGLASMAGNGRAVGFAPDGKTLLISTTSSPYLYAYDYDSATEVLTAEDQPSTIPTGYIQQFSFGSGVDDSKAYMLGHVAMTGGISATRLYTVAVDSGTLVRVELDYPEFTSSGHISDVSVLPAHLNYPTFTAAANLGDIGIAPSSLNLPKFGAQARIFNPNELRSSVSYAAFSMIGQVRPPPSVSKLNVLDNPDMWLNGPADIGCQSLDLKYFCAISQTAPYLNIYSANEDGILTKLKLNGDAQGAGVVALSSDGTWLVHANTTRVINGISSDNALGLWKKDEDGKGYTFQGYTAFDVQPSTDLTIAWIAFSPLDDEIVVAYMENTSAIFLQSYTFDGEGNFTLSSAFPTGSATVDITQVEYSSDGLSLAAACSDNSIRTWMRADINSAWTGGTAIVMDGAVNTICWHPDGLDLAVGQSNANGVIIKRRASLTTLAFATAYSIALNTGRNLGFSPDGSLLSVGYTPSNINNTQLVILPTSNYSTPYEWNAGTFGNLRSGWYPNHIFWFSTKAICLLATLAQTRGNSILSAYKWVENNNTWYVSTPLRNSHSGLSGGHLSQSGDWVTLSHSATPFLSVYTRVKDGLYLEVLNNTAFGGSNSLEDSAISPDENYLIMMQNNSANLRVFPKDVDNLFSSSSTFTGGTINACGIIWSSDSSYFVTFNATSSPYFNVWKNNHDGTFTKLSDPSTLPTAQVTNVAIYTDTLGSSYRIALATSAGLVAYTLSSDVLTLDEGVNVSDNVTDIDWSANGTWLAVTLQASPYFKLFKFEDGIYTDTSPSNLDLGFPDNAFTAVAFSPSTHLMAVGMQNSPYLKAYDFNRDTGTIVEQQAPAVTVASSPVTIDMAVDSTMLVRTADTKPMLYYVEAYEVTIDVIYPTFVSNINVNDHPEIFPSSIQYQAFSAQGNGGYYTVDSNSQYPKMGVLAQAQLPYGVVSNVNMPVYGSKGLTNVVIPEYPETVGWKSQAFIGAEPNFALTETAPDHAYTYSDPNLDLPTFKTAFEIKQATGVAPSSIRYSGYAFFGSIDAQDVYATLNYPTFTVAFELDDIAKINGDLAYTAFGSSTELYEYNRVHETNIEYPVFQAISSVGWNLAASDVQYSAFTVIDSFAGWMEAQINIGYSAFNVEGSAGNIQISPAYLQYSAFETEGIAGGTGIKEGMTPYPAYLVSADVNDFNMEADVTYSTFNMEGNFNLMGMDANLNYASFAANGDAFLFGAFAEALSYPVISMQAQAGWMRVEESTLNYTPFTGNAFIGWIDLNSNIELPVFSTQGYAGSENMQASLGYQGFIVEANLYGNGAQLIAEYPVYGIQSEMSVLGAFADALEYNAYQTNGMVGWEAVQEGTITYSTFTVNFNVEDPIGSVADVDYPIYGLSSTLDMRGAFSTALYPAYKAQGLAGTFNHLDFDVVYPKLQSNGRIGYTTSIDVRVEYSKFAFSGVVSRGVFINPDDLAWNYPTFKADTQAEMYFGVNSNGDWQAKIDSFTANLVSLGTFRQLLIINN